MKGTFYGVGVGPGDPKLLTLLAVETIEKCPVIAVPDSGKKENIALTIAKNYISGKEIINCLMPMTYDKNELQSTHEAAADKLCDYLDHSDVCFITLGDPTIYSTYMYLHNMVKDRGYETVVVPGVPSFCAVGAKLNTALCIGSEALHIIPAASEDLAASLDLSGTKVIMKSGQNIEHICDLLTKRGLHTKAGMVSRCTMADEVIYTDIQDIKNSASYFSTLVVKE